MKEYQDYGEYLEDAYEEQVELYEKLANENQGKVK